MQITSEYTRLILADDASIPLWVSRPKVCSRPKGVIVLQEGFGVNAHIRNVACRLSQIGYVAVAPELFHRTAPPHFEVGYDDVHLVKPHIEALTDSNVIVDLSATHAWLTKVLGNDNITCIGFCMGGRASFLANSALSLRATVSYYGGRLETLLDRIEMLSAPMLLIWGGADQYISASNRYRVITALQLARKTYINLEFSTAQHGFFCEGRTDVFDPKSSILSWRLACDFIELHSE